MARNLIKIIGQESVLKVIKKIEKKTPEFAFEMNKRNAIVFLKAASLRTKPGIVRGRKRGTSKVSKLAKKYRIRPVVENTISKQSATGEFWYKNKSTGKIFSSGKKLSRMGPQGEYNLSSITGSDNLNYEPVKRAIKAWDKKRNKFILIGTNLSKGFHDKKETRIPGAGAGKAGWLGGLRSLGGRGVDTGKITRRVSFTLKRRGKDPFIMHINKVGYVRKTSPSAVSESFKVVATHIRKAEEREFDRVIRRITGISF